MVGDNWSSDKLINRAGAASFTARREMVEGERDGTDPRLPLIYSTIRLRLLLVGALSHRGSASQACLHGCDKK
ncbi:unnamed protein product [Lasius platythorax]|uniref:Uncharacterized protein n=1 Tax=Lasius platythorax TaxID=488582 RepID=A0AAV2NKL4_9HYME